MIIIISILIFFGRSIIIIERERRCNFVRLVNVNDMSESSVSFLGCRNNDLPDNRNLSQNRCWNRNGSGNGYFFIDWILNMLNIILLVVFLNNRLSDNLFSWNLNCFSSNEIIYLKFFINIIQLNLFIISLLNLEINTLSLYNRLNVSLSIDFSSRFLDSFYPFVLSNNWLSLNGVHIHNSVFLGHELYFFLSINHFSLQNWLVINFSVWSVKVLSNNLFRIVDRLHNLSMVDKLVFSFLDIQNLLLNTVDGLNISLSISLRSRNLNRKSSINILIVNDCVSNFLFSVYWSRNFLFSDDRSLNNSLFDNRL